MAAPNKPTPPEPSSPPVPAPIDIGHPETRGGLGPLNR